MNRLNQKSKDEQTSLHTKLHQAETSKKEYFRVKSLRKALGIIELLAQRPKMTLSELSESLSLTKSNIHRLVLTLKECGYLEQSPDGNKYSLSLKIFQIGCSLRNQFDFVSIALPFMENLASLSQETINLGIWYEDRVLLLEKILSPEQLRLDSPIGNSDPLHSTALGRCLLAGLSEVDLEIFLRSHTLDAVTRNTVTNPNVLRGIIRNTRKLGFAVDDEETLEGVYCIAAPIRIEHGRVVAAISISAPKFRMKDDKIEVLKNALIENTHSISLKIGYSF